MTVPQEFTPSDLIRFLHRYNFGYCVFGIVVEIIAFLFWIATIYGSILLNGWIPLTHELPDWLLPMFVLCAVTGIGYSNTALVFSIQYDNEFPAIKKSWIWIPMNSGWSTFLLMIFCAAPLLTCWGISIFCQCFSYNRSRILLAWTLYHYLNNLNNKNHLNSWVPYPKFESQRQAIFLLYRLDLVRVSHRFGVLQVTRKNGTAHK
ncbi:MAG: hypothetical protein LBF88_12175 [Planctomycetaceae bacterium]|jgi:hypothetical protein|nr:hypothetical protein [Planctomycetaceae bacterium]